MKRQSRNTALPAEGILVFLYSLFPLFFLWNASTHSPLLSSGCMTGCSLNPNSTLYHQQLTTYQPRLPNTEAVTWHPFILSVGRCLINKDEHINQHILHHNILSLHWPQPGLKHKLQRKEDSFMCAHWCP